MDTNQTTEISLPVNWKSRFFIFWTGQAFSLLGSQLVQFALIWYLTQRTGSAIVLTTASLCGMLPQVFIGPLAGALIDRWNRRLVMIVSDALIALATLGLAALFWMDVVEIWHIYALMFLRSVGGGFHWPAMQASTSLMVPKEHYSRVQGFNQMLSGVLNIGSAPLGALLLSILPMQGVLSVDVITALIAISSLAIISIPQPARASAGDGPAGKTTVWQDLVAGVRYLVTWPGLLMVILMATAINFLASPVGSLIPILVTKIYNGQAFDLALLESAIGGGVLAGGLLLSAWGGFRRRILTTLTGLVLLGFGLCALAFAPADAFWQAVAASVITGIAIPIANGPLTAVVQAVVAPNMQGRIFTLMSSVATAMTPVGLIIAGPVAERFGVQFWFLIAGIFILFMGVWSFFIPVIRHIEDGRSVHAGSSVPGEEPMPSSPKASPGD